MAIRRAFSKRSPWYDARKDPWSWYVNEAFIDAVFDILDNAEERMSINVWHAMNVVDNEIEELTKGLRRIE